LTTVEREEGLFGRVGGAVEEVEVGMALFGVDEIFEEAGGFASTSAHLTG
jgi:hypothetical protein